MAESFVTAEDFPFGVKTSNIVPSLDLAIFFNLRLLNFEISICLEEAISDKDILCPFNPVDFKNATSHLQHRPQLWPSSDRKGDKIAQYVRIFRITLQDYTKERIS